MNVYFKEKITRLPKDAPFEDFKHEILKNEKLVIKIFFYKDKNLSTTTKRVLICANVGDSKGFLIKKNNIIQITKDHDCKDKNEVERIKKEGGAVFQGDRKSVV